MKLLAIDTSTDTMQLAVTDGQQVWQHSGPGGAAASGSLIPAILALLAQANLHLPQLAAIAFGAGPGSFTGLRSACAVAQGLAFGAGLQVLPVSTLLAVAQEAHHQYGVSRVLAVLDARMDEVYAQAFDFESTNGLPAHALPNGGSSCSEPALQLAAPEALLIPPAWRDSPASWLLAGNAFEVYSGRLLHSLVPSQQVGLACPRVLPSAAALLRLAPVLLAAGAGLPPEQAHPHYVRNRVAQTSAERELVRRAKTAVQEVAA